MSQNIIQSQCFCFKTKQKYQGKISILLCAEIKLRGMKNRIKQSVIYFWMKILNCKENFKAFIFPEKS